MKSTKHFGLGSDPSRKMIADFLLHIAYTLSSQQRLQLIEFVLRLTKNVSLHIVNSYAKIMIFSDKEREEKSHVKVMKTIPQDPVGLQGKKKGI